MSNIKQSSSVRKASSFLKSLGLSYDKVSPATQKYLLDMNLDYQSSPEVISSSVIGMKFNNKINSHMSGGRISFPIEYYGTQTQNYVETSVSQNEATSIDNSLVRTGLEHTGGSENTVRCMKGGYLTIKDYKKYQEQYEKKFLRKLKLSADQKKMVIRSLNEEIEKAFIQSVKDNKFGRLTLSNLKKNLKN
jgi:hypothetical protein